MFKILFAHYNNGLFSIKVWPLSNLKNIRRIFLMSGDLSLTILIKRIVIKKTVHKVTGKSNSACTESKIFATG